MQKYILLTEEQFLDENDDLGRLIELNAYEDEDGEIWDLRGVQFVARNDENNGKSVLTYLDMQSLLEQYEPEWMKDNRALSSYNDAKIDEGKL